MFNFFKIAINKVLHKRASAIQTIKCIRDEITLQTRILLLNTFLLGHLHYPCMLWNGCTEENLDKMETK